MLHRNPQMVSLGMAAGAHSSKMKYPPTARMVKTTSYDMGPHLGLELAIREPGVTQNLASRRVSMIWAARACMRSSSRIFPARKQGATQRVPVRWIDAATKAAQEPDRALVLAQPRSDQQRAGFPAKIEELEES